MGFHSSYINDDCNKAEWSLTESVIHCLLSFFFFSEIQYENWNPFQVQLYSTIIMCINYVYYLLTLA